MKKVFAILLVLALMCSALAIVPAAAGTNEEITIKFSKKAPVMDGAISPNEYGASSLLSWSPEDGETDGFNTGCYEITDDEDLEINFYATWTDSDLYLAWKVKTKYDFRLPDDAESDGYMYEYCCVQFIITPGAPDNTVQKYQTSQWAGDYLEIGICQKNDDNTYKVAWSQPDAAGGQLKLSDWEAVATRDEAKKETVYECRIPWGKSGIESKGDGAQFGLTWAVGAQENYDTVAHGLVEWCDAIVGGKNADNSAIVTLEGSGAGPSGVTMDVPPKKDECSDGDLPAGVETGVLGIDMLDDPVASEQCSLITNAPSYKNYNTNYSTCLLLSPVGKISEVDGWYKLVERKTGAGETVSFDTTPKKGDIVLIVHSDGSDNSTPSAARKAYAEELAIGTECYLFGFQLWETENGEVVAWKYSNAQLCPKADPAAALYGTWSADGVVVTFNSDKTVVTMIDGVEVTMNWEMSEDGVLKIEGEVNEWSVDGDVLTLDGVAMNKVVAGDYSELQKALTTAQLLKAEDYTEESYAALTAAIDAAKAAVEAEYTNLDQAKIDDAKDALTAAIEGLVKADAETSEDNSAEASTEESVAASEAASTETPAEDGGFPVWAIILIVVVVVAVIAVVVIVVVKKKK